MNCSVEKALAPHSSTLAWKIPWTEESSRVQSMGWLRVMSLSLSCIGEGNGNPLHCSCLENHRDGGAWWAAVCGVTQSRTRLKRLSSSSWENRQHISLLKYIKCASNQVKISIVCSLEIYKGLQIELISESSLWI